jgi:hypothetical protein
VAAVALTALLLVASRHGPIHAMSMAASTASDAQPAAASSELTAVPFDVSSRVLPDELPPPAEPVNGMGQKP